MGTIYHLLDEAEMFSEQDGGAISRWAANVLRQGKEVIVCPGFDASWNFNTERLYVLPNWKHTDSIHPVLYRLPWSLQKAAYSRIFRELISKLKVGDIVYVHNRPECASVLATLAQRSGVTIVLHMHNSHLTRANKGQLGALKEIPIVFCSEFLRNEVEKAMPDHFSKTHVVRNGADGLKFRTTPYLKAGLPTIIFTGRLVPYKGVHILMEAMHLLQERGVEAKCQIVGAAMFGNGRTTQYVRNLARLRPANTEMLGYKGGEELAELLRQADIFCCPSIWKDPFPLAPIEAMASGLPVVASHTGGLPEVLCYGGGVMVPPNDSQSLAAALQELIENPGQRRRLSCEASQAFREHFLWDHVRAQYNAVIEKVDACR
jgi:spore coat protein SA